MGGAPLARARRLFMLLVIASLMLLTSTHAQFDDEIVFNAESTDYVLEEQSVGTAAVVLEAYYVIYSPFQLGTDGIFALDQSQPDSAYFTIESAPNADNSLTLGTIRNAAVLDRDGDDAQTMFSLIVTYSTPDDSLSTQHSITIFLLDVNDNSPQFSEAIYSVPLLEAAAPGSQVIQVTATDIDEVVTEQLVDETGEDFGDLVYLIDNGRVFYSIAEGDEMGQFEIDLEGGTIFVSPGATFDVDEQDGYNLTVVAMDAPGLNTTTLVQINILDSNDNPPQIVSPGDLNFTLSEDTPAGLVILDSINATDEDRGFNAAIQFLILSGDGTNSFTIDPLTGKLTLAAPLDREGGTGGTVTLIIAARDQGLPPLQDTMTVVVFIEDVNDFPPLFQQPSYEASVREGVRSNFEVTQVVAMDGDEGPGGVVSYSILEGADDDFYIDPQSGKIFTNGTLDREERAEYELTVLAVDNPLNASFQLSSVVSVTIAIEDLNDNQPIFNQVQYEIHILDNLTRGSDVIQVSANDSDEGVNAAITYEFTDPLPSNSERFRVQAATGIVKVNQRPRFDIQTTYNFTIRALDGGFPPLYSDVMLTIFIHDVNESPPTFEEDAYNVTLNETVDIGTVVLQVQASDPDPGPIGLVRYRIISEFDEAGSFSVDSDFGVISVKSRLDFDARNFSFFQVEAYDEGFPEELTDVTNVTIFLVGENDEPPSITFPAGYFPTVPEDEPPGYDIVYLSNYTTDPDMGLGGEFNFSIYEIYDPLSEGTNESFSVNTSTGLLRGLRVFDREAQPHGIVVAMETSDFGVPPQSTVTNITVMIGDKNDHTPFFLSNRSIVVYEYLPPGVQNLSAYRAMDEDIGINAELEYEIYEGDPRNQFSIDPHTGGLFTAAILNKTDQKYYNLTIIARDGGTPQFHTFGQIEIEVIDSNDQVPTFTMDTYIANVSENVAIGTVFFQVNASDGDLGTNADIQYFLNDGSEPVNQRFSIDSTTGEIATGDVFDRENDTSFVLHVVAIDNGTVPMRLTGSAMVLVNISDRNDHTPLFHNTTYMADVVENSPNGTFVFSVSASDDDAEGPNNDIIFSLNGSRSDVFQINPTSGDVTVAKEVDWEEGGVINIIVIATDLGEPPRYSTADATIFIEDVNDRPPTFTPGSLSLGIFENTSPPAPVAPVVIAIDPDSPGNGSRVTYDVITDLAGGKFELDSETGEVTFVRGTLNRERRPFYELHIRALDHGDPQFHTDGILNISVLDTNDFDPVFDSEHFVGNIAENAPQGATILTLGASDMDEGTNAELSFYIIEDDSPGYFGVNESSGDLITATDSLDFELRKSYPLVVMVTDHGVPQRSHTSRVTVSVTDFNDNPPVFTQSVYSRDIEENLSPYTTVLRVTSSDEDSGTNQMVRYSLAEGEGREYFDIDPETGVLHTVRYIDREVTPSFELTVVANNSLSPYPVWSNVTAMVTILDLSDTHPSFSVVTHVYVDENASVGSAVFNLSATDGDEGLAGSVRYDDIHGNEEGIFHMNSTTGVVTLQNELDFESVSFYEFVVSATDMATPNLTNYTTVVVHVVDVNDNSPFFVSSEYTITVDSTITMETVILDLVAVDPDSGSNSELEYEIEGSTLFSLQSPTTPSLYVAQSLEDHAGLTVTLVGTVRNPTPVETTPTSQHTNITIHVRQSLLSLPRFTQLSLAASVPENEETSTALTELSLFTIDVTRYEIEGGNTRGIFTVDNAGTVSLSPGGGAMLDHETQPTHQLTIRAENMAGDEAYRVLTVAVTDVNDVSPQFVSPSLLVHIPETTPVGETFFVAMATDTDGTSPANEIDINFVPPIPAVIENTFAINSRTGALALKRTLDYESGDYNFTFEISASNEGAIPILSSVTTVTVVVVNGNNHAPVFTSPVLDTVVLYENQTTGISIFNATATDADEGSSREITFGLRGNHRYSDFSIDTHTGEVVLSGELDRERETQYQLVIVAADRGNPGLTSTTLLVVGVQDVNDNTPEWEQLEYSVSVHENISVDEAVVVVEATDPDQVDFTEEDGETIYYQTNGLVQYSITDGDPRGQFFIEPLLGVVTIAASLDRELIDNYTLTLTATDGGGRAANATLVVMVIDTNDVSPVFSQDEYVVGIPENSENGTFLITVSAIDTDLAHGAFFFYDIDTGNIDDIFSINGSTGEVMLEVPALDREEIRRYNLTVVAIDFGDPSLTGTAQVIVHVLDLNEFPPVFDQETYTGPIAENSLPLTPVLTVNTSDLDYGENATATYTIVSNDNQTMFEIEPHSGQVYVAGSLDFEERSEYNFIVMATDSGPISTQLSSEVNITVIVTDVNDNAPLFLNSSYSALVREDSSPLSPVLTLQASDADSGVNAEISFSLDPQRGDENFTLHPHTGVLSISPNASLDYETQSVYQFIAITTDAGTLQLNSTVLVTIAIKDVNDNIPIFTSLLFNLSVPENSAPGLFVIDITATDADTGDNGRIIYSIRRHIENESDCLSTCTSVRDVCTPSLFPPPPTVTESPFTITNITGEVNTAVPLDREENSSYLLAVQASDLGNETSFSSLACLLVTILDENDNSPTFPPGGYTVSISENTGVGVHVALVNASDEDEGMNGEVSYRLVTETSLFAVHPNTGDVMTLGGYDRELRDEYDVIVVATDGGDPPLNSSTVVRVTVVDENDNAPLFNQSEYTVSFAENQPPQSSVLQLQAVDADIGTNAELNYSIQSSIPQNHFSINASSGLLVSTVQLDREEITSYLVTIISTDKGFPPMSSSTQVNITILDRNDHAPIFTENEYFTSVVENVIPISPLLRVSATDDDSGTNSIIQFILNETRPHVDSFSIYPLSGAISLLSPLDAESSLTYTLSVVASNEGAVPNLASVVNVTVTVGDVNDHTPQFSRQEYVTVVSESAEVGSEVIRLIATDGDATSPNSDIQFEISGGHNVSLFSIDPRAGSIFIQAPLDREREPSHSLQVRVRDNGTEPGQLESVVNVTFVLQDANDNIPVFDQMSYLFSINENNESSILIGRVQANDIDLQSVNYSIAEWSLGIGSGSASGSGSGSLEISGSAWLGEYFEIDPVTGEIYTATSFDREERELYTFYVVATDNGTTVRHSSEVLVRVLILDQNDVAPSFSLPGYTTEWPEDTAPGSSLLNVLATDIDTGLGGTVRYSLSSNHDSQLFAVSASTGEIALSGELDRERQDQYLFEVIARDYGEPSLTGSAVVMVTVLDVNDNEPILSAVQYTAVLAEDTPLDSTLISVAASDADIASNANVTFSLSSDFNSTFVILNYGNQSGIIYLASALDYEHAHNYTFFVVATDNGTPPLSTSSEVIITVVDLNDNPPIFAAVTYHTSIPENAILGTPVFQIPATDADSTSNGELRYSILSGNVAAAFEVDEVSGLISLSDYIDREITGAYSLSLRAVDLGTPQFTAHTELVVEVVDVNDHIPRFGSDGYRVSVPELSGMGTIVENISATDDDSGVNANLTYSITAGDPEENFYIDPQTGVVEVRGELDFETVPSYSLTVLVSDQGEPEAHTDTVILSISIVDENEHRPSYPQSDYIIDLPDNTPPGARVGSFVVSDDDLHLRPSLLYTLSNSGNTTFFNVDQFTGDLYTLSLLPPNEALHVSLVASDGTFSATTDVTVTVFPLSSPSFLPVFQPPSFLFSVSEDTTLGERVGLLGVINSNDVVFTLVDSSLVDFPFEVTFDGEINLIGRLDYEATPTYLFSVQAVSTSNTSLVSHTVVAIVIDDANDNPPTFESSDYYSITSELTPVTSLLLTVSAYDLDSPGGNSDFQFSITGGNEGGNFNLDPSTGELRLSRPLDYEEHQMISLNITVSNHLVTPPLSSEARVCVDVLDENDHSPQFIESYYQAEVSNSAPYGTSVLTLSAVDRDSGSNAELSFSLTHSDLPLSFSVNHTTGVVSVGSGFSGDVDMYVVAAAVSDRGAPQPRSDTTTIFITVVPDNNFAPVFSEPGGYSVVVAETLPIGGSVAQIFASDPDSTDSVITYTITSGDPDEIFTMDPSTGLISLATGFDYQAQSQFQLEVTAEDNGTPSRYSPVAVNISIEDINNHAPSFEMFPYIVSILENTTVGQTVANITASDVDALNITYILTINSYDRGLSLFAIDSITGVLTTTAPLDREVAGSHELLVSAVDSGYPLRLSNSVPVSVIVLDLNDTPPQFDQSEYVFPLLRYLASGLYVSMVTATDSDLIGQQLEYSILEDTSGSIFGVNSTTGVMFTTERVPEDALVDYQLTLTAFDGDLTTSVSLTLELTSDGHFCQDSGLCTDVIPVNCSFIEFGSCDPRILGPLYDPFCTHSNFMLSPDEFLCVRHYCSDPSLSPCLPSLSCLPPNMACDGECPTGTALCPTTQFCHVTSLRESCDGTNRTCLIGQILVETVDAVRECRYPSSLPPSAQSCTEEQVYCLVTDVCANTTSPPPSCPTCPLGHTRCTDTGDCVTSPSHCCGENGFYCSVLDLCLADGDVCELPNISPAVFTTLIHVESVLTFVPESGDGHMIAALLSNSSSSPATDSQGEEVSVAVIETSPVPPSLGEWQYTTCANQSSLDDASECELGEWVPVGSVSEDHALLLPSIARLRFLRRAVELEGVVWVKVKLWDGNEDGYLSPTSNAVRHTNPHHGNALPFSETSAFSENSTLLTVLLFPVVPRPSLPSSAPLTLSPITEDTPITGNPGNTVEELVLRVIVPELPVLPEDVIQGLPATLPFSVFEDLEPLEVREYIARVKEVNPTRLERLSVVERGLAPGVGIRFSSEIVDGRWQVSWNGDVRRFVYVSSLLSSTNQILLLNTTARIRFIPNPDYCGEVSILFYPWDGYWNETETNKTENGFLVTSDTSLSQYNVNDELWAMQTVWCVPDTPSFQVNRVQLDPIPYYISYTYERLFTIIVAMETGVLRSDRDRLSELLHVTLEREVHLLRIAGHTASSSQVSFSVEGEDVLFSELQSLLMEKTDILHALGLPITDISQTAHYGPGEGCSSSLSPLPVPGVTVTSLTNQIADDRDGETLGMAVIDSSTSNEGVWQYLRGNWSNVHQTTYTNLPDFSATPHEGPWINFPGGLTESHALLLHPMDRLRYLPRPSVFWSTSPPSLSVKTWDTSIGRSILSTASEAFLSGINTDPFMDTTQSLFHTIGLFSYDTATIEAGRRGCDDVINSGLTFDPCCVCGGDGGTCAGCDGVHASGKVYGYCDECGGDGGCEGCDLVPFSNSETGACDECVSVKSVRSNLVELVREGVAANMIDCDGVCLGTGVTDDCGMCIAGDSAHFYNSNMDCAGVCDGSATVDDCGYCTGPGTMLTYNWNLDCTGVCGGPFRSDSCGICQLPDEEGEIVEHRDCLGVCFGPAIVDTCGDCYGDPSSELVGSSLDVCGVCGGQNSTCVGCNGSPVSGVVVDTCGMCGGNDCGCYEIDVIEPQWGPRSGGTVVLIHGAGFFLNDSSLVSFDYDPQSDNCGAPREIFGGESVMAACQFASGQNNAITADDVTIINQSTIRCVTKATTADLVFDLTVSIETGPHSNAVVFRYYDDALVAVSEISPVDAEIDKAINVSFYGNDFVDTGSSVCFMYDNELCRMELSGETPLVITANYISENEIVCTLPAATVPCEVRVQLSLDGQSSGVVTPGYHHFTYRSSAPRVELVHFSQDLSDLIVQFDRPVRPGDSTPPSSTPTCGQVFSSATLSLLGTLSDETSCYWVDTLQDALAVRLPPSAMITTDSIISFRAGAIATRDQLYSYTVSDSDTFTVDPGPSSVLPVAIIDGLHSIPACGDISFTGIHSLNPGYGGMLYRWSVLTADSTTSQYHTILTYLDSLSEQEASISLSSSWFVSDVQYYIQLVVLNSVGGVSDPSILPLVTDEDPPVVPQVYVVGQEVREVRWGESVTLEAAIFIPECLSPETLQFSFNWQLYQLTDTRRGTLSAIDISSLPATTPVLYLPPSLLSPISTYLLSLTVRESTTPHSDAVNLSISVSATEPRAVIQGGDRTVSTSRMLILDARGSVYDLGLLATPTFSWSCNVIGSGEPCYNHSVAVPTPIAIPLSELVSIPGSDLEPGLNYNFTVTLSHTNSVSSSSSVAISVTRATPPIVEVTVEDGLLTSHEVVIRGLVYSETPVTSVLWESVPIEGHGFVDLSDPTLSLTPTTHPLSSVSLTRASPVNLVLPPNTVSPGLTHTFQLTASSEEGTSFARVSISPDSPPHSTTLTITPPTGGTALQTEFVLTASGALDKVADSPYLYQFGFSATGVGEEWVWVTGAQVEPSLHTLLPSGVYPGYNLSVVVRVFDRRGGYSDASAVVTVQPETAVNDAAVLDLLIALETEFTASRDWQHLLTNLVAIAMEIDSTPTLSPSLKQEAQSLFLEVFSSDLPATATHYQLATHLLSLLVTNTDINIDAITDALTTIGSWFRGQSTTNTATTLPVVNGNQDEPLQLLPVEGLSSPLTYLPHLTASHLLASWSTITSAQDLLPSVAISFTKAVETIGLSLCQRMVYGETTSLVTSSAVDVSVHKSPPTGQFMFSRSLVEFGTAVLDTFYEQACPYAQQACFETCLVGAQFSFDLFSEDFLHLAVATEDKIFAEIEGSDPQAIELLSNIISVTVSIPSQNGFLNVKDLDQEIGILLPLRDSVVTNGSIPLCLYREFGGRNGFTDSQWQLDTTSPPTVVTVDSVSYYRCYYSHLTQFAVGILPPPIIPPPPSPTPTPSPLPPSTPSPPPSPVSTPTLTVAIDNQAGISPAVFAVPVLLVAIIVVTAVCVVAIFLVWKKKKRRTVKISPGEGPSGVDTTDGKPPARSGPLTPEESKVPMPIIELQQNGERAVVGSMSVLPAIRLRELRYHLLDHFASFKSKPFYFLTRQLVDIEPPTEQQQFVSLVYGDEADKPIFVRRVETNTDLTKLHFCVCGNAAQFECSSCSARGYCSPECQTADWADRHQRECGRLGEKKQRMSVLRRQSTTLSPVEEHKKLPSIFPERQSMSAATPLDFRSLLNSQRSFQRHSFSSQSLEPSVATPSFTTPVKPTLPPLTTPTKPTLPSLTTPTRPLRPHLTTPQAPRTTLSMLASQPRPPTIKEESEGEEGAYLSTLHSPTTPTYRPPVQRYSRTRLGPLSSTPARTLTSLSTATPSLNPSSPLHSTPITSSHSHTSPTSQFFTRTDPKLKSPQHITLDTRKLSIQSLGPVDYSTPVPLGQLRGEPQLNPDPHMSSGSEEEEGESRPVSTAITTRPPSLSVRSKRSAASRNTAPSSSSGSSESDSEDDSSSSAPSQPTTPLVTEQK